jgi:hypothetical protein
MYDVIRGRTAKCEALERVTEKVSFMYSPSKNTKSTSIGRAAAANPAAVPPSHTSRIHFDWFQAAGNASRMVER